jgi:hypothetical protein
MGDDPVHVPVLVREDILEAVRRDIAWREAEVDGDNEV